MKTFDYNSNPKSNELKNYCLNFMTDRQPFIYGRFDFH